MCLPQTQHRHLHKVEVLVSVPGPIIVRVPRLYIKRTAYLHSTDVIVTELSTFSMTVSTLLKCRLYVLMILILSTCIYVTSKYAIIADRSRVLSMATHISGVTSLSHITTLSDSFARPTWRVRVNWIACFFAMGNPSVPIDKCWFRHTRSASIGFSICFFSMWRKRHSLR